MLAAPEATLNNNPTAGRFFLPAFFFAYEHCYGTRPRTPKGETSKKTGTVFPHLIRLFLFAHS